jgi:hypothetical protein
VIQLAQEHAFGPHSSAHKPGVFHQNGVEADDLVKSQIVFARLKNDAAPPLQPVARRTHALDFEARTTVGQKNERQCPRCAASNEPGEDFCGECGPASLLLSTSCFRPLPGKPGGRGSGFTPVLGRAADRLTGGKVARQSVE